MGVLKPELIFKSIVPIIMAGILGIYGLIVCIIIFQNLDENTYTEALGYKHLAAGLCCGFSSLVSFLHNSQAAGLAIGIVGDAGVRANAQ